MEELHRFVKESGRVPTTDAWDAATGYPGRHSYTRRFGSWGAVLTRGGYKPNKRGCKKGHIRDGSGGKIIHGLYLKKERVSERGSTQMASWREKCLDRDGYKCRICDTVDGIVVHHMVRYSEYPELRLDVLNGYTVCSTCHEKIHRGEYDKSDTRDELLRIKIQLLQKILEENPSICND